MEERKREKPHVLLGSINPVCQPQKGRYRAGACVKLSNVSHLRKRNVRNQSYERDRQATSFGCARIGLVSVWIRTWQFAKVNCLPATTSRADSHFLPTTCTDSTQSPAETT